MYNDTIWTRASKVFSYSSQAGQMSGLSVVQYVWKY